MRFQLKNFGVFREADLEIPGLTVIVGENGTGKSTLCKALFTTLDILGGKSGGATGTQREVVHKTAEDFYYKWQDVENQRYSDVQGLARRLERAAFSGGREAVFGEVYGWMDDCGMGYSKEELAALVQYVTDVFLNSSVSPEAVKTALREEFGDWVPWKSANFEPFDIQLTQGRQQTKIRYSLTDSIVLKNAHKREGQPLFLNAQLGTVLDVSLHFSIAVNYFPVRIRRVIGKLQNPSDHFAGLSSEVRECSDAWQDFCGGALVAYYQRLFFQPRSNEEEVSPSILPDGFKVPAILQALLSDGVVSEGGTLIWEEPGSHLHPKQQVKLAELIVRLQKALKLHVLLTTNSPYLVSALDVYSRKYDETDTNRWYVAERTEDGCVVRNVTGRRCEVYDSLTQPYQAIEDEAMQLETGRHEPEVP